MPIISTVNGLYGNDGKSKKFKSTALGLFQGLPAPSAQAIKLQNSTAPNGWYWILINGVSTYTYCLMDSGYTGGGWMLCMKAPAANGTFNYSSGYWRNNNNLNPTDYTLNAADAKYDVYNYFVGKDMLARFPDITGYSTGGGSLNYGGSWTWYEPGVITNYAGSGGQTMLWFFSNANNWGSPTNSFGSSQLNGGGAGSPWSYECGYQYYGFGFNNNCNSGFNSIWGFNSNNEGDNCSNDIYSGIGLNAVSYSCGDYIGCCACNSGMNRQARMEIYIR
jgi:hypothetical protein